MIFTRGFVHAGSHYEPISHCFTLDEVVKNDNGRHYKVVQVENDGNVWFQNLKTGEYVKAYNPKMYVKTPQDTEEQENVIEWEYGKYYSQQYEYENIVFMQIGEEADEVLKILDESGEDAALEHLKQWDYGESPIEKTTPGMGLPWGSSDSTYIKDGYIMSYNLRMGYIGLIKNLKESLPY